MTRPSSAPGGAHREPGPFRGGQKDEREAMENGAAKAAAWYTSGSFTFFEAKEGFIKTAAELEVSPEEKIRTHRNPEPNGMSRS